MPRGGRRPGAGGKKGNFNAMKGGAYSRRMKFALATLLTVPEYRELIRSLHMAGEEARKDVTDLLLATSRLLYDRPVNEELRKLVDKAAANYIDRVGPRAARAGVRHKLRALGVDEIARQPKPPVRVSRRKPATADPVFQEFARLLTGVTFDNPSPPAERPPG
jgi:hypothetical protein